MAVTLRPESLQVLDDFYARLQGNLLEGGSIIEVPKWIMANTKLKGKAFSFKDHEMQIEIASCQAREMAVKKCSQVGISELQVRITLALLAIRQGWTAIYILPHAKFAAKFAKGRIDPVISESVRLSELLVSATDSSELKRFGSSFLYINGASNESQAISVPADIMVVDERDFCNELVLGVYNSRLRHSDSALIRNFSTPSLPDFGIDNDYNESSKGHYFVKCEKCGHWQAPLFSRDVIIPGFDQSFEKFDKRDLSNPKVLWKEGYIPCGKCKTSLERSFSIVENRQWVFEKPSVEKTGFWIKPFDVIKYNATPIVLGSRKHYGNAQRYWNYVLGETYASDDNQINISTVKACTGGVEQEVGDVCVGIDVGKMIYITIGVPDGKKYRVVKRTAVSAYDGSLVRQVKEVLGSFRPMCIVTDSQPDFSFCLELLETYGEILHPALYVVDNPKKPDLFELPEKHPHNMVYIPRTSHFNELSRQVNSKAFTFQEGEYTEEAQKHYLGMKKSAEMNENGELVTAWKKVDEDHFLHSLGYMKTACDIIGEQNYIELELPLNIASASPQRDERGRDSEHPSVREALQALGLAQRSRNW